MTGLMDHTKLLNHIIEKYGLNTYLEIGVQWGVNFHAINLPLTSKVGVDPDPDSAATFIGTSDDWFKKHKSPIDLAFLDGFHIAEQVKKDFENALKYLTVYGMIVLHDTVPELEERTLIPRETKQWNGNVYSFACKLGEYDGIDFKTFEFDHGCTVIWIDKNKKGVKIDEEITWEYFQKNKTELLRVNTELPQ